MAATGYPIGQPWVAHAKQALAMSGACSCAHAQPSSSHINSFFQGKEQLCIGRMWNNPIHKHFMHVLSVLWKFLPGCILSWGLCYCHSTARAAAGAHDAEEGEKTKQLSIRTLSSRENARSKYFSITYSINSKAFYSWPCQCREHCLLQQEMSSFDFLHIPQACRKEHTEIAN